MCVLSPACIEAARTGPPELVIARWLSRNIDYAANGHREWSRNNGRRRDQGVVADCRIRTLVATSGRGRVVGMGPSRVDA
jgi:hypothetical protein